MFWFKRKKKEKLVLDGDSIIGHYGLTKEGAQTTHVVGEKFPLRGNPQFLALRALDPIKSLFDRIITGRLAKIIPFNVSNEKLSEPVREIARVFDLLIEAEKLEGQKQRWRAWKKVICVFLEHDIAYRYRFQWVVQRIDKERIKLVENKEYNDNYFFRLKNFRVDLEEEWQEAFKKYPQLKLKQEEFRDWLSKDSNWFKNAEDTQLSLAELAPRFLNQNETKNT